MSSIVGLLVGFFVTLLIVDIGQKWHIKEVD